MNMVMSRLLACYLSHTSKLPSYSSVRSGSTHVFNKVIPWKNSDSLAQHLAENIIYNKDGVIAVTKPYGVCSTPKGSVKQYLNAAPVGDFVFNIYDALPYLAKKLDCKDLFLASIPERYTSGVAILTTSSHLLKRIKNSIQLSKVSIDTVNQYYAVVVGSPYSSDGSFHLGIKMSSKFPNQPILVPHTKTGVRKQNMHSVRVVYNTLSTSNLASLVAIRSSTARLNALRIICTDKFMSPILGDNMFGSRVKNVLGRDVLVGFNQESVEKPMKLKPEVLQALELSPGQELIIPNHLHLHEIYLAKFFGKDIVLRAPLPPTFQWSCQRLGLEVPDCGPCENFIRKEIIRQKINNQKQKEYHEGNQVEIGVVTS